MFRLPQFIPGRHVNEENVAPAVSDVNTGGYDFTVGGYGFRSATSKQFPYSRATEKTTAQRFDNSTEPGEQSLPALPWIKSQSSFHGGAGQINLETPVDPSQLSHIRFRNSLGVDVWTPGKVTRLPDTTFANFGFSALHMVTAAVGGFDYAVIGGNGSLYQVIWADGPNALPAIHAIDLASAVFGGQGNVTVKSMTTDGVNYYALINLTVAGSTAGVMSYVISGPIASNLAPVTLYDIPAVLPGVVGWVKERLMAAIGNDVYELSINAAAHTTLPTAKYSHPLDSYVFTAISDSPAAILMSGNAGLASSIMKFDLDTSGGTPTLTGGATIAVLPVGEQIVCMQSYLGSFLGMGTTKGVRLATFNTYTGALSYGPISLLSTKPVNSITGRDRFILAGWTDQQANGQTGLARIDISQTIDQAGRLAWAPDLRPPSSAPTGRGIVTAVGVLPLSDRIIFLTEEGIHVEGDGPGIDGPAWLETSRIRYDTAEPKLFKLARIHGELTDSDIGVTGLTPFGSDINLGTFGPIAMGDPGQFRLPSGLNEWIALRFSLNGADCVFASYQVDALPAPQRQHLITLTGLCFEREKGKDGVFVTESVIPRDRLKAIKQLEAAGNEVRFVEYTNRGPSAELVVIDQAVFIADSPPNVDTDFGGWLTFTLRSTEN